MFYGYFAFLKLKIVIWIMIDLKYLIHIFKNA